jgi:hypothetical protein
VVGDQAGGSSPPFHSQSHSHSPTITVPAASHIATSCVPLNRPALSTSPTVSRTRQPSLTRRVPEEPTVEGGDASPPAADGTPPDPAGDAGLSLDIEAGLSGACAGRCGPAAPLTGGRGDGATSSRTHR